MEPFRPDRVSEASRPLITKPPDLFRIGSSYSHHTNRLRRHNTRKLVTVVRRVWVEDDVKPNVLIRTFLCKIKCF